MSEHKARIVWDAPSEEFTRGRFSRAHTWTFDGGVSVPASASPAVVRAPLSDPAAVDPEEAFVAALSSCHMLTFLWVASKRGFTVRRYEDDAVGVMTANERGVQWVSQVTLRPRIDYGDKIPTPAEVQDMHAAAHDQCYVANSVRSAITVEPAAQDFQSRG
jgi:organic hydroperoxide reductase OsmC/OhrA